MSAAAEMPVDVQARYSLTEALRLAAAGYPLTAVTLTRDTEGGKRAKFHENWRKASAWSTDSDRIRDWWVEHPDTSYAVRTGASGGADVIDLDVKDGIDAVEWWAEQGYPVGSMIVDTISGGLHLYLPACGLPTVAGQFAPGVDTRGDGGLVFAPGAYIVGEPGCYRVRGGLVSVSDLEPLPADLVTAIKAAQPERSDHPADGRITVKDRDWMTGRTKAAVDKVADMPLHTDGSLFRDAQMGAAMMLGRLAEAGLCDLNWARKQIEDATLKVWPDGLSEDDHRNIESGLRDGPRTERWRLRKDSEGASGQDQSEGAEESSDAKTSWSPIDLGPYINGTITRPEPTVGAQRRDGLRFFYPGLEHAVIGQTEGGKTWFLLASAAAELMAGNRVAYIHFEENDPGSTVSRLLRQFRVPAQRLLDDFLFFGPEHPIWPGRIDELCVERVPTLAVLDGVNEAMALHAQKINDPDGSAEFRRRLVKPWTRHGAAVAAADHVVKDANVNGSGYALGSVHKVNALSGAGFLIENREAFGEGLRGNSGVYVVKDRPGVLRKAGNPTNVPRKYHLAEMSIDDTGTEWQFELHTPRPTEGGPELLDPNDWRGPDQPLPPSDVLAYEGPGCKAIRELAQFMRARATGGGAMSLSDATRALVSVKSASGEPLHRRDTVKRAWQALHETLSRLQLANPTSGPNAESCWIAREGDPK